MEPTNHREVIFDKLNGALASYRRERDDYLRKKELASERLQMKREERLELEKAVQMSEKRLERFIEAAKRTTCVDSESGMGAAGGKSLEELETEAEQLRKEVISYVFPNL